MFVDKQQNMDLALRLWAGKPTGRLLWTEDLNWRNFTEIACGAGYPEAMAYGFAELGCLFWIIPVTSTETTNPFVTIVKRTDGADEILEYRSPAGMLTERRCNGQIVKHKVESAEELAILIEMWRHMEVRRAPEKYADVIADTSSCALGAERVSVPAHFAADRSQTGIVTESAPRCVNARSTVQHSGAPPLDPMDWRRVRGSYAACVPVALQSFAPSAIQHFLQHQSGVANFWYLMQDATAQLEEAMALWQATLDKQYRIMETLGVPRYYQAENTSTTMISPQYYEQYSLGHIQQLTASARRCGARTVVHMCGLLYDLMPHICRTGMNGIHMLTPPPLGNVQFDYAYKIMPKDCLLMGCFGSLDWIGKTKQQVLVNLRRVLPQPLYRDHAFILIVTADGARFTRTDLDNVRDAIEVFEREGG